MAQHRWVLAILGLAAVTMSGCRVATLGLGETTVSSGDGLGLKFDLAGKVVAVTLDGKELPAQLLRVITPGGFFVRGAGTSGNLEMLGAVQRTEGGVLVSGGPAGLRLQAAVDSKPDRIEVSGRLINPGGRSRGVTVGLSLPVNAAGWLFGRSILEREPISGGGAYAEWTCADSDWDGRQINRGMFTPIYSESVGLALGATCDHPEIFRVSYKQGAGFTIEADLGLSPIPQKFPNTATFKFILFRFEPAKGYRSALAKYYRMFPEEHRVRAEKFGNWTATGDVSRIKAKAADHAVVFASHGARHFEESAKQGYYAFEYSRCHYNVIPIYGGDRLHPRPPGDQIRRAVHLYWSAVGSQSEQTWKLEPSPATRAEMGRNCHTWGPDGQMQTWTVEGPYHFEKRLYPEGYMAADIPTNPDPDLASPNQAQRVLCWNFGVPLKEAREGKFKLAGHHFDSWTDFAGRYLENHRPTHLRVIDYPLTFSYWTGRPTQHHMFMWQELLRPLAEYLHSQGMLLFVNARPWRASVMFDQGLVDIYGGSERPERNIEYMAFMRSLVGAKPISGTGIGQAATDPDRKYSTRELAQFERDLNILLPYCWFPGGFGPKGLWRKYCLPMQEMAAAGWEPLPGAVLVHPDLLVECYGGPGDAKVFYAVHNLSEQPLTYEMAIDLALPKIDPQSVAVIERITGERPEATTVAQSLVLRSRVGPRGTNLFQLSRGGGQIKPNAALTLAESPRKSSIPPLGRFDPKRAASGKYPSTLARLDLRPRTGKRFLAAYGLEKREIAAAVAWHLRRENAGTDEGGLNRLAAEIANWLAPRFDSIYEAVLPGPVMMDWIALRANYKDPSAWQLGAVVTVKEGEIDVRVWDPLLEKP